MTNSHRQLLKWALDQARRDLVDLSRRNRLLHAPLGGKRPWCMAVVGHSPDELFDKLHRQENFRGYGFSAREGDSSDEEQTQFSALALQTDVPQSPGSVRRPRLQTRLVPEKLEKRLAKIFREERTLEEEQGLSTLYLALGFLKWLDSDQTDESFAPLVLVPVTMTRTSGGDGYLLRGRDDEIVANISLREKLKTNFGIQLPDIPDDEHWKPSNYFDSVSREIRRQPRWEVDRHAAGVGFFTFSKFMMWRDLDATAWPNGMLLDHPLLNVLLGENAEFETLPPLVEDDKPIDERIDLSKCVHVVDADSSQAVVIEEARDGRNRGVPQGLSPSDVLAKVYLNAIDQAVADIGIDYIRYVDDMRIFCFEIPACKKALMFLTQALRRRGLNLQSAKTEIVSAEEARNMIEGIAPVIAEVHQRYKEFLTELMGSVSPYMTISEIEEIVDPDDAPVEVVREVFRLNFLEAPGKFNKTLFHYLLNRLGAQGDGYAIEYCLNQFTVNPQETQAVLAYAQMVGELQRTFAAIEAFFASPDCIYDYQVYQIFQWLNSLNVVPPSGLVAFARHVTLDNARPAYLRAVCRITLQNHGTMADLDRLEASYGAIHDDLEKAQVLVSLKRLEIGRRNAFYGRVVGDGPLCERAIRLVKEQRL